MSATRNGRPQRSTSQRKPAAPATALADDYALIVGGLVACRKCAALLLDTRPARDQHATFHQSLRKMWDALGSRS